MSASTKRRAGISAVLATAFLLSAVGVAAAAGAGPFKDVGADDTHVAGIQWVKDNGVTKGCNPPTNTNYCPDRDVNRAEMATFMQRLGTNIGAIEAVIDGKKLGPVTSADPFTVHYLAADGEIRTARVSEGVNYTKANCKGDAYADSFYSEVFGADATTIYDRGDGTSYVASGKVRTVDVKSSFDGFSGECFDNEFNGEQLPLKPTKSKLTLERP